MDYENWTIIVNQITEIETKLMTNEVDKEAINQSYNQIQELLNFVSSYLIAPQRMLANSSLMITCDALLSYIADSQMINLSFDGISETENEKTYKVTVNSELRLLYGASPISSRFNSLLKEVRIRLEVFNLKLHSFQIKLKD